MVLTTPLFHEEVHRSQGSLDGIGVSTGFVDFVDGKDDGHTSSHCVVDGFLGLWHHVVVGSNDDDGDVGDLRTTSTHSGEGFVTRGVEEGDFATILEFHVVSTDVLGDTTSLTSDDIGIADVVEERRLTVVNVTHHRDDRRTLAEVFFIVHLFDDSLLHFGRDELCGETKFFSHHFDGFLVETLVDRHHDADAHAGADDLCHGDIHHRCQFVGSHKFGELQHAAFSVAAHHIFFLAFASGIALLTAIFRTLTLVGALSLKTSEGFFHLLSHIFVAGRSGRSIVALLALLASLATTLLLVAVLLVLTGMTIILSTLAVVSALSGTVLFGFSIDIDTLVADAVALLAIAFFLALFLRLLLGARAAVDGREVHGAEHFRTGETRFGVEFEHAIVVRLAQMSCLVFNFSSRSSRSLLFSGRCLSLGSFGSRSGFLLFRLRFRLFLCLRFGFLFSLCSLFFSLLGRLFESIEVDVSHHLQSAFGTIVGSRCFWSSLSGLRSLLSLRGISGLLFSIAHGVSSVSFFGRTLFFATIVETLFSCFLEVDVVGEVLFQGCILFFGDFGVEGNFSFKTIIFERVCHALDGDVEFFDYFV